MLGMRIVADIDVLGDAALQARIARASALLLALGLVGTVAVALAAGGAEPAGAWWWVALAAATVASLPVHELVHAAGFKLLAPGCRVTFGAQAGFLYACANGAVLPRRRMVAVLLAPAVLVTGAMALLACMAGLPSLAAALASLHVASCAGDLLMAWEVVREPACTHVRDTDSGVELLAEGPAEGPCEKPEAPGMFDPTSKGEKE